MEEGLLSAGSHPLTVSKTAPPLASPGPSVASCSLARPKVEGGRDHVTSKDPSSSVNRSRFYFESDTLALKNNPE